MMRLDIARESLPKSHQIRKFLKGIIDDNYKNIVSNIWEKINDRRVVSIQDCYSKLRTEENWLNKQAGRATKAYRVGDISVG